jgi:hypothetical protein
MTMLRNLRTTLGLTAPLVAALAAAALGSQGTPALDPHVLIANPVADCVDGGATAADQTLANTVNPRLSGKMSGEVSAYTASCLRAVVTAVKDRGLPERAAVIAVTTAIVESSIRNITKEVDHDSLGIFQQRGNWGSRAERLNPVWATNAFLDKMIRVYPNDAWQTTGIGVVCQKVQVSAFGERYQPEAADAQILVNAVWDKPVAAVGAAMAYDKGDGTMRIFRWTTDKKSFDLTAPYDSGSFSLANVGDRMASGDVNGDGKDDIVMAYQRSDRTFAYYTWLNGNSAAQVWYTSGSFGLNSVGGRLVLDDFNGDKKAEPAMAYDQGDGTMRIYRWLSDGNSFNLTTPYDSGSFSLAAVDDRMTSGDINGDGNADIVMAYQRSDGTFAYYTWLNGNSAAQVWYTSGSFNLNSVAGRLVLGNW